MTRPDLTTPQGAMRFIPIRNMDASNQGLEKSPLRLSSLARRVSGGGAFQRCEMCSGAEL